jgi:hypothetical protein
MLLSKWKSMKIFDIRLENKEINFNDFIKEISTKSFSIEILL